MPTQWPALDFLFSEGENESRQGLTALVLAGVALGACFMPAARAARLQAE
jgi:hypothetical protein